MVNKNCCCGIFRPLPLKAPMDILFLILSILLGPIAFLIFCCISGDIDSFNILRIVCFIILLPVGWLFSFITALMGIL